MTAWQPIETAPKPKRHERWIRCKGANWEAEMYWHQPGNPQYPGFYVGEKHCKPPTHWLPAEPPK